VRTSSSIAAVARDHARRHEQDGQGERDRQQERPAPAELREQAAEDEAEGEAAGARRGVDRERAVAVRPLAERGRDDRQACGRRERRAHALDQAGDDEQRAVADETADRRRDDEDAERVQQHAPAPEHVGRAAAEQEKTAVAEDVSGDDPLQLRSREAQIGPDRRERDADHRHVEPVEEENAAQHHQEGPGAGVPAGGDARGRSRGGTHARYYYMQLQTFHGHIL
jgi:hypothetical protein